MKKTIVELRRVCELLATQDDGFTSHPYYLVQRRVRDWGYDDSYRGTPGWIHCDGEEVTVGPRFEAFEAGDFGDESEDDWTRSAYVDRWEFVDAYLTRAAAEARIKGAQPDDARIYVASAHRNHEIRWIRELLPLVLGVLEIREVSEYTEAYGHRWRMTDALLVDDMPFVCVETEADGGASGAWPTDLSSDLSDYFARRCREDAALARDVRLALEKAEKAAALLRGALVESRT